MKFQKDKPEDTEPMPDVFAFLADFSDDEFKVLAQKIATQLKASLGVYQEHAKLFNAVASVAKSLGMGLAMRMAMAGDDSERQGIIAEILKASPQLKRLYEFRGPIDEVFAQPKASENETGSPTSTDPVS